MRRPTFAFPSALILTTVLLPTMSSAQTIPGTDWQLLAVDGVVLDMSVLATLRIEEDGRLGGKGPCNSWSAQNAADLPALSLTGIRATRMACDKLAEEQQFFDALPLMTGLTLDGDNLILSGPDGRTLEFVTDRMNSLATCSTCPEE